MSRRILGQGVPPVSHSGSQAWLALNLIQLAQSKKWTGDHPVLWILLVTGQLAYSIFQRLTLVISEFLIYPLQKTAWLDDIFCHWHNVIQIVYSNTYPLFNDIWCGVTNLPMVCLVVDKPLKSISRQTDDLFG
jgi:hypothetical protein